MIAWQTLVAVAAAGTTLLWSGSDVLLAAAGHLLVSEDAVEPVAVIATSMADPARDALEAARLYREGVAGEIVLCTYASGSVADDVRRLGVPLLRPTELARAILVRSGVPPSAIVVLPEPVDGTSTEIAAIAHYAEQRRPASLLLVIPRSHTARARYLLQRALPAETRALVRAPGGDAFAAGAWWQHRLQAREVLAEYLRWLNTLAFGDHWSARPVAD